MRSIPNESPAMGVPRQHQNLNAAVHGLNPTSSLTAQSFTTTDHSRERLTRPKLPTIDEAIDWYTEWILQRDDKWGVTDEHFRGPEFFENMSAAPISSPSVNDGDLASVLEHIHAKRENLKRRMETIAMNEPLKASMHLELDRQILALSNHKESTKSSMTNAGLGRKVATLYKQTHPIPNLPKNSVPALVHLKPLNQNYVKVNLPIKAFLNDVYSILIGLLCTHQPALSQTTGETYDESTTWTYRFTKIVEEEPGFEVEELDEAVVPLLCDMDYRIMMDHVIGKRKPHWGSVLLEMKEVGADKTQIRNHDVSKDDKGMSIANLAKRYKAEGGEHIVCPSSNSLISSQGTECVREMTLATNAATYDDDPVPDNDGDSILDEDGNPYFDKGPIDWNKFYPEDENVETDYPKEVMIRGRQGNIAASEQQQKQHTSKYNLRSRR